MTRPLALDVVVTDLIAGLERLQRHYQARGVVAPDAGVGHDLALALALLRNTVAPAVAGVQPPPLHVAVMGGTNCGKSTLTNVLIGASLAACSVQGAFTTMPTGYGRAALVHGEWQRQPRVLQPLRGAHGGADQPSACAYGLVALPEPALGGYLEQVVVWDTPDIDSRYALQRRLRVLEIVGLADVAVVVLSKEKYADAAASELLDTLLASGKSLLVCLNKFAPSEYAEGVAHFRQQMLETPERRQAVGEPVMLGYLEPAALARLWSEAGGEPGQVRAALQARLQQPPALRRQTVRGAVAFLAARLEGMVAPARQESALLVEWQERVAGLEHQCLAFYAQHYLYDERRYDSFRLALMRLLDLLDVPGLNRVTRLVRQVVTTPVRWGVGFVKGWLAPTRGAAPRAEAVVLREGVETAGKALHTLLMERQDAHPFWAQLRLRFEADFPPLLDGLPARLAATAPALEQAIDAAARRIYERLQASPVQLQALRGGKLALEIAVLVATVKSGGLAPDDLLYGPLAYAGLQAVVEVLGERYVQTVKRELQQTQERVVARLVRETVVLPLLALTAAQEGKPSPCTAAALLRLRQQVQALARPWSRP